MWIVGIVIIGVVLVWLFVLRSGNFVLVARNVTYTYEHLKRTYGDAFDSPERLMLAAAIVDTTSYLRRRRFFVDNLESIVSHVYAESDTAEEVDMLEKLITSLECLIFETDSRLGGTEIFLAVSSQKAAIRKAIERAKRKSADGKDPPLWRRATDNFMLSPAFESLRERIGVGEKPRESRQAQAEGSDALRLHN